MSDPQIPNVLPGTPAPEPVPASATQSVIPSDRYCIRCGYSLAGLVPTGNCPECGTSIELSLRERTLAGAAPEYLATLRTGLSLILNGILLLIVVMVVGIAVGIASGARGTMGAGFQILVSGLSFAVTAMILLGYWRYTQPDPGQVSLEATNSARSVARVAVGVQVGIAALNAALTVGAVSAGPSPLLGVFSFLIMLAGLVVWAVQFFAIMRYTRWIGTRVPDQFIIRRTKLYMWLLPLLYTVGILVLGLGPLVALVLYWNLLDRLRKHVKSIMADGRPADLAGRLLG